MTNPTLERAHAAAKREIDKLRKNQVEVAPGRVVAGLGWANLNEVVEASTRAVLMAVLPTLERWDLNDGWGYYEENADTEGSWVRYADLQAILNDGEGE